MIETKKLSQDSDQRLRVIFSGIAFSRQTRVNFEHLQFLVNLRRQIGGDPAILSGYRSVAYFVKLSVSLQKSLPDRESGWMK